MTQTGPLDANELSVNNALIIGPAHIKESLIKQLTITANSIIFEDSQIDKIIVKSDDKNTKQTVTLLGNTIINQNITFESGIGEVIVKSDKVQLQGIIGGKRVN
jgi:hypothetical protein